MVFSSIVFLLYFLPAFFLVYFLLPGKFRNVFILIGSILFYSWGAPKFIFMILGTTLLDFFLVRRMDAAGSERVRKTFLIISISVNLGLLFYFKYCNFFIENINEVLPALHIHGIKALSVILPIGISFYTFETITYVMDVYRRVHKPLTNFWDYQLYIIFFPKLIAGPIVRFHEISDQIYEHNKNTTADMVLTGIWRFIIGLAKKVLIANNVGVIAQFVFTSHIYAINTSTAWLGLFAYTFQIYFDFSGYSDMAIGLAQMMGFRLPENFNHPYTAVGITSFWRHWHITLGKWMKNYLYIPLGGNKKSKTRTLINLVLVFLASGLWHGAAWTFIIWGAYHGLFLVLERGWLGRFYERIGKYAGGAITFFLVMIGWVYFRSDTLHFANEYIKHLFSFTGGRLLIDPNRLQTTCLVFAFVFSFSSWLPLLTKLEKVYYAISASGYVVVLHSSICLVILLICIVQLTSFGFNPFIYFRF